MYGGKKYYRKFQYSIICISFDAVVVGYIHLQVNRTLIGVEKLCGYDFILFYLFFFFTSFM